MAGIHTSVRSVLGSALGTQVANRLPLHRPLSESFCPHGLYIKLHQMAKFHGSSKLFSQTPRENSNRSNQLTLNVATSLNVPRQKRSSRLWVKFQVFPVGYVALRIIVSMHVLKSPPSRRTRVSAPAYAKSFSLVSNPPIRCVNILLSNSPRRLMLSWVPSYLTTPIINLMSSLKPQALVLL